MSPDCDRSQTRPPATARPGHLQDALTAAPTLRYQQHRHVAATLFPATLSACMGPPLPWGTRMMSSHGHRGHRHRQQQHRSHGCHRICPLRDSVSPATPVTAGRPALVATVTTRCHQERTRHHHGHRRGCGRTVPGVTSTVSITITPAITASEPAARPRRTLARNPHHRHATASPRHPPHPGAAEAGPSRPASQDRARAGGRTMAVANPGPHAVAAACP